MRDIKALFEAIRKKTVFRPGKKSPASVSVRPYEAADKNKKIAEQYTLRWPEVEAVDRETPWLDRPLTEPRYHKGRDGYWHASDDQRKGSATIMFTGDLMCRGGQQKKALDKYGEYCFDDSFSAVRDTFREADLVMGNLEATLCARSPYMSEVFKVDGKPNDNAPPTYLAALRNAGYDLLSMANNHNCDAGAYGILDTISNLNTYEFIHTGTFRSASEKRYVLVEVNGIRIAVMSYAVYFNDKDKMLTENGRKILLNRYSRKKLEKNIQKARDKGAEFIIAYIHWGNEYTHEISEGQQKRAQAMADAGVDYIIGSHPHVLQRYDVVTAQDGRKVPVFYSMGNFMSNISKKNSCYTIISKLQLRRNAFGAVEIEEESYIPCYIFSDIRDTGTITVPLTEKNRTDIDPEFFDQSKDLIQTILGDGIRSS